MIPFEPLWADLGWIIPVIVVIITIITVIGNVIAKINEQQAKGQRRPGGVRPPRPRQPRPQVGAGGGGRGGIQEEITEFLRRAAGGQAAPQQPQAPPPPRPARRAPAVERVVEAEIVADDPGRRAVGAGIDTSAFDQRTSQLGGDVAQADRQFGQRLEGTFDREVSELAQSHGAAEPATPRKPTPTGPVQIPPTAAAGFAAILSNADNIRQAIVLSEILNRPLDRWQ